MTLDREIHSDLEYTNHTNTDTSMLDSDTHNDREYI